jgi:DNA-binding SARP family transcriptional activator
MTEPVVRFLGPTTIGENRPENVLTGTLSERALWHLYLRAPHPVETAQLAEAMWAEQTPKTWQSAFRTHIARLRRFLEAHPAGPQLLHDSSGYRLTVPPGSVDVEVFRNLIQQSKTASTPTLQYELLVSANNLFFGEPFYGSNRNDLRETTDRLLGIREESIRQRRFLAIELGRAQEVIDEFVTSGETDHLDSMIIEPLVAAYLALGQNQEARALLSAHRSALEYVGLEPGSGIAALERRLVRTVLDKDHAAKTLSTLPPSLRHGGVHVGRTSEHTVCSELIESDAASFVLVQGPAGIGKSHFARSVAQHAQASGSAVLATWVEESPAPGQPIDELLRSFALPGSVPSSELVETLLSTLVEFAESRRLLVIFDDLHNADLATVKILRRILRRDPIERVTFVFTAREGVASPHAEHLLREMQAHVATRTLVLPPLSRDETYELVKQRQPDVDPSISWTLSGRLHRMTDGFPLLLDLLLANFDEHTGSPILQPIQLDDAVAAAAQKLKDDELDILIIAALVGIEADIGVVASVSRKSVAQVLDANDRARVLGLTSPTTSPVLRFRHSLIQKILPTFRSRVWRCERHRTLAAALATQGKSDDVGFAVACQLAHAVAGETTGELLDEVLHRVERLHQQMRWEEALTVLEIVEPLVNSAMHSPRQRYRTSKLLALSSDGSADSELSRTHFRNALELAKSEMNAEWIFEIAVASGASSQPIDGDSERAEWLKSALEPQTNLAPTQRLEVLAEYVYLRSVHEVDTETRTLAAELEELSRAVGTDRGFAFAAHGTLVVTLPSANPTARIRAADAAIVFGTSAPPEVAATPHLVKLVSLLELGRFDEASACLVALEELTAHRERPADRWGLLVIRAMLADWSGNQDSAQRYAALALDLATRHHVHGGTQAATLFQFTQAWRTNVWEAFDHYQTTPITEPIDFIASSLYFAATGDHTRAQEALQLIVPALCEGAPFLGWLGACMVAGEAAALVAPQFVDQLFEVLLPYTGLNAVNGLIPASTFGPVDRVLALLANAQGRTGESERFLEQAHAQVEAAGLAGWRTGIETLRAQTKRRLIDLTKYDHAELTAS